MELKISSKADFKSKSHKMGGGGGGGGGGWNFVNIGYYHQNFNYFWGTATNINT